MEIRLFKPSVGKQKLATLNEKFNRLWIIFRPKITAFEAEWGQYRGSRSTVDENFATVGFYL